MTTQTRKPKTQQPLPVTARTGLCVNCLHQEHCTICRNSQRPILACEEHAAATLQGIRFDNRPAAAMPAPPEAAGLCVSCEHRHACTMQQVEGGIWHCEEFI